MIKYFLNKDWQFSQAALNEWRPAEVPGTVHTDLFNNGMIKDPFYRTNERHQQWIDKVDWEYRTVFDVPAEVLQEEEIALIFYGLDTYAYIFLNGHFLMNSDNMFRTWRVNIRDRIQEGPNELLIFFRSPVKKGLGRQAAYGMRLPAVNDQSEIGGLGPNKISVFTRKAGYHYGWDWGPRFATSGIWRPVELLAWSRIHLEDVYIRQNRISSEIADLEAQLSIRVSDGQKLEVFLEDSDTSQRLAHKSFSVDEGDQLISLPFSIQNPRLWWSNGLGKPELYRFRITVVPRRGQAFHYNVKTGLRHVRLVREPDGHGESFFFELNGVPVFAKGANYIPNDVFLPRVSRDDYRRVLSDAAAANMNMIRVWGGGIYEDDFFYELCDEKGIMVWQDFMFACSMYPGNDEFLGNVRQEAVDNVIRLRNHPSVVLWCGNNEINTMWRFYAGDDPLHWKQMYSENDREIINKAYLDIFHGILPQVVAEHTNGADYWPSSPQAGYEVHRHASMDTLDSGDQHYWGVWHELHPFSHFEKYVGRFMSEYGFQSFPSFETVKKYTEPHDRHIESEVMAAHQRSGIGNLCIREYMSWYYPVPDNFEQFLYLSQVLQAGAIKQAIETHRCSMPRCMGSLYWQLNDCWPVASWSGTDYYRNWKALHYAVRDAFEPVIIVPRLEDDHLSVTVVSDRLQPFRALLKMETINFSGKIVHASDQQVDISANGSTEVGHFEGRGWLKKVKKEQAVIRFTLLDNDEVVLNRALFYFVPPARLHLAENHGLHIDVIEKDQSVIVEVSARKLVRDLMLYISGEEVFFSFNFFDVIPGETMQVLVHGDLGSDEVRDKIRTRHLKSNG
ncbi:MAG: glycoside hydrolase family 2 protein [Marinilabilia sp.]